LAQQLLTLAEGADKPAELMLAHGALGVECLMSGEFAAARKHLEQASPRLDWSRSGSSGVFYRCFGAWALWALGYADQAVEWSHEVLASAEVLSRWEWLATALALTARLHMFLRDAHMAQVRADAAIAIATEHGFPYELAQGTFVHGWALAHQGHLEEGVAEMRRAATALEATGFVARPRWLAFLAEACAKSDDPGMGLKLLGEGMASMKCTGERIYEAELHRLKGEFLLMCDAANALEAEDCFRTAVDVARRQGGRSLELRATVSLTGLLEKNDRRDEARTMLAQIYNWFTEGFETADLKDARALLDELGGQR